MAIETNVGHITQAINFSAHKDLFLELGKPTDWTDPKNPDNENATTTDLSDSQAFIKINSVYLVAESDVTNNTEVAGDSYIIYKGKHWLISTTDKAIADNACYVLVEGTLGVSALDPFKFTQIGVRQGTVFADSVKNNTVAKSSDVKTKGSLLFYENRMLETYTDATAKDIKYLMRF